MAVFQTNSPTRGFVLAALMSRVSAVVPALRGRYAQYQKFRQTHDELNALSARELNDLGLTRGDIVRISREAAGY